MASAFPISASRSVPSDPGYTLVELMIGMSLWIIVITVTLVAWMFIGRNFTRMQNSQYLEAHARSTFQLFNNDVSTATKVTAATSTSLSLTVPSGTVSYSYSSANGTLTRTDTSGNQTVLISDLTAFSFNYFNTTGTTAISNPNSASIKRIELTFSSSITNSSDKDQKASTYSTVSPRVALSNLPLLQ
jgi:Tfp pilus assembly protein PilW